MLKLSANEGKRVIIYTLGLKRSLVRSRVNNLSAFYLNRRCLTMNLKNAVHTLANRTHRLVELQLDVV